MAKAFWATVFTASFALSTSPYAMATGLDGTQVTVTAYCCTAPIPSNAFTVPESAIVGPGIEFPSGSLTTTSRDIITSNVDVSSFGIDIRYTTTDTAASGTFNGFGFDFSGQDAYSITGVSLNPLSTFAAASVGLSFDRDSVYYSGAGLPFTSSSRVLIDIVLSPVPEPASGALFAAGLGFLIALIRQRGQRRSKRFLWATPTVKRAP
jgi:hypothetical protein